MATQKRRVVYLSDAEWAAAKRGGEANEESISSYIAMLIRQGATPVELAAIRIADAVPDLPIRVGVPGDAEQLFGLEFRPVPKPGRR